MTEEWRKDAQLSDQHFIMPLSDTYRMMNDAIDLRSACGTVSREVSVRSK